MRSKPIRVAAEALTACLVLLTAPAATRAASLRVAVHNDLDAARPAESVEVPASLYAGVLGDEILGQLRVLDEASGQELLAQAIDLDDDRHAELVVFQADFAPKQTRTFLLSTGERRAYRAADFKVYGRFVRERHDDFAWENDRVAFRVYGEDLETWTREPLTSSAIDAWSKNTARLVLNEWYMVDDYHHDHGEGGDFYPAGATRGCGGSGLWIDGSLVVSKNFRASRVLAAGPIRLVFELDYPAWQRPGLSETRRVTLDAGSHMNRVESFYVVEPAGPIRWAAGTKVEKGAQTRRDVERGLVRAWEHQTRYAENGWLGCGVAAEPGALVEIVEAAGNLLLVGQAGAGEAVRYYAGTGWDGSPYFNSVGDWDAYLDAFVARLRSPLRIEAVEE